MYDLEEVFRRNAQRADEPMLDRARHLAETRLVVLSFEDMNLGHRHCSLSLSKIGVAGVDAASLISQLRNCLDRKRDALPAANAQCDDAAFEAIAPHGVNEARGEDDSGRANRVTVRDRTTFHVGDVRWQA